MELKLTEQELKAILLVWAQKQITLAEFNTIDIDSSYSHVRGVTFSFDESLVEKKEGA